MHSIFGNTTSTRSSVTTLDQEAMNTTDQKRLEELCRMGSALGCQYANMKPISESEKDKMALNRELDAAGAREAIATQLAVAGVNTRVVESVKTGRDIIYAKDIKDAEEQIKKAAAQGLLSSEMASEVLADFYNYHTPWYRRTKTLVVSSIAISLLIAIKYLYF